MKRTLSTVGLGLTVSLVGATVVVAQPDQATTVTHSSQLNASVTKAPAAQTPSVTINGQSVPVQPNATTHFNDGTTQAAVQNSGTTTTSGQNSSSTSVNVTNSNSGNGTSTSDVTTSGNDSITVTSNSSVEASGSGVTVTSN